MKNRGYPSSRVAFGLLFVVLSESAAMFAASPDDHDGTSAVPRIWAMAKEYDDCIRFSTLFTAQNVRDHLATSEGLARAIRWCKQTAVTHVYLETFRGGFTADRDTLLQAKRVFEEAGFLVSGCVTTTSIGKTHVKGQLFPCFTDPVSRETLDRVFRFTASLFDEIMVDDFFATRCECDRCIHARGEKSWSEFRCDLMLDVSRRYVLQPARQVNPDVTVILKYPRWYGSFQKRGYDVVHETELYDKIWVGTETRDPDNKKWGKKSQYGAFYLMQWLGRIGGDKCGGGWFDPFGTSPATYVEQARQTVLGGAREAVLFCYGSLQNGTAPANVDAFRAELPRLFELARLIRGKQIRGVAAPKPPNSDGEEDRHFYDFLALLGIPLLPCTAVPEDAQAVFLAFQTLTAHTLVDKLPRMVASGKPVLVTDHLAEAFPATTLLTAPNVRIFEVPEHDPGQSDAYWSLMDIPEDRLRAVRGFLLRPFGLKLIAPTRVALYLFDEDLVVIENFNDTDTEVVLTSQVQVHPTVALAVPSDINTFSSEKGIARFVLPSRSLIAVRFPDAAK